MVGTTNVETVKELLNETFVYCRTQNFKRCVMQKSHTNTLASQPTLHFQYERFAITLVSFISALVRSAGKERIFMSIETFFQNLVDEHFFTLNGWQFVAFK